MDIDKYSFPGRLLDILEAISQSHFVSFDLELSGVPVKQPGKNSGKPSLQERYLETKAAAEKYHILQIGLTCVREDIISDAYVLRPYNINLSPVVPEDSLRLERTISFHSGAIDFLLKQGFDFGTSFAHGVPYLSRKEAENALERATSSQNRSDVADIVIRQEDVQALAHLDDVRAKMDEWIKKPTSHQLLLQPSQPTSSNAEFNRYEMRLIHQVVRNEYPEYVTVASKGHMRVFPFDAEREEYYQAQRLQKTRERIVGQTGFRWVVDALCGKPAQGINPDYFAQTPTGAPAFVNRDSLRSRFNTAQHEINEKKTVLVGHNLFLDLIYLYKTFIGDLPDTVEEFSELIHDIFPIIVDTKYMATHKCGDINPQSSLSDIADQLEEQEYPQILVHQDHGKYHGTTALHEAGYDSMLTAQIAIRLSAKLEKAGTYIGESEENRDVPSSIDEAGGVQLASVALPATIQSAISGLAGLFVSSTPKAIPGSDEPSHEPIMPTSQESDNSDDAGTFSADRGTAGAVKTRKEKKNEERKTKKQALKSPFAHSNVFDVLTDGVTEEAEEPSGWDDTPAEGPSDWDNAVPKDGLGMPRFTSEFWKVYGNKLRVFGTKESVAMLA